MRRARLVLAAALALGLPAIAQAWGDKGHRITGLVAQALLSEPARARLKQLMGDDDLAAIAVYMDKNRSSLEARIPGSRKWHYDDLAVCPVPAGSDAQTCADGNCASARLPEYRKVLTDAGSTDEQRRFAVWVLAHLIGDIHQPLHAATHDDKGGNDVKVVLAGATVPKPNLHEVWDVEIIERLYHDQEENAVARRLISRYSGKFAAWRSGRFGDWIEESNQLARSVAYGKLPGFRCDAKASDEPVVLTDAYLAAAEQVVPEQLARAGVRMAWVLNQALAPAAP
jgi:hypothetical protein